MIKWDGLLVALGAFAPLSPRTDQADVALQGIPQLRQLIEAKFPKPAPHTCHPSVAFARINIIVCLIPVPAHRPEFQKNESLPVATDPFLAEQDRSAVLRPDEQRNKDEERQANDERRCRGEDIENPLEVMIRRSACQLKPCLERPERIDNAQRQITPVCFVKGFQGVDSRFPELRVHEPFQ